MTHLPALDAIGVVQRALNHHPRVRAARAVQHAQHVHALQCAVQGGRPGGSALFSAVQEGGRLSRHVSGSKCSRGSPLAPPPHHTHTHTCTSEHVVTQRLHLLPTQHPSPACIPRRTAERKRPAHLHFGAHGDAAAALDALLQVQREGGGGGVVVRLKVGLHLAVPLVAEGPQLGQYILHVVPCNQVLVGGEARQDVTESDQSDHRRAAQTHFYIPIFLPCQHPAHLTSHCPLASQVMHPWGQHSPSPATPLSPAVAPSTHLELALPAGVAVHAVGGVVGLHQRQHAPDVLLHTAQHSTVQHGDGSQGEWGGGGAGGWPSSATACP